MKTKLSLFAALPLLVLGAGEPALARAPEPLAVPTAEATGPATDCDSATADQVDRRDVEEAGCCNGMGGPLEEEAIVVVGPFADQGSERRYRLAPIDPILERRYAPRPAASLNPITLRF